jgi:hypothetical protein
MVGQSSCTKIFSVDGFTIFGYHCLDAGNWAISHYPKVLLALILTIEGAADPNGMALGEYNWG